MEDNECPSWVCVVAFLHQETRQYCNPSHHNVNRMQNIQWWIRFVLKTIGVCFCLSKSVHWSKRLTKDFPDFSQVCSSANQYINNLSHFGYMKNTWMPFTVWYIPWTYKFIRPFPAFQSLFNCKISRGLCVVLLSNINRRG